MGAWRAVVTTDQQQRGCGFVAAPGIVLTCAHVIGDALACRVELPVTGWAADDCLAEPAGQNWDLACVRAPFAADPVPLGAIERPPPGTPVDLFGLPGWAGDRLGRRVRGRLAGASSDGRLVQIDALDAYSSWVVPGFSGGAVLDGVTGLAVGMVVIASDEDRTAWLMPLDEIAGAYPWIRHRLARPLLADHEFHRFRVALDRRDYTTALHHLADTQRRRPSESDAYYYWALALLGGHRPARHSGETIEDVLRLLAKAIRLDDRSAHAAALLAVVLEDCFTLRGVPPPAIPTRIPPVKGVTGHRAQEITHHVPAAESHTWRFLRQRSRS